jgi:subtilisin family serine protease
MGAGMRSWMCAAGVAVSALVHTEAAAMTAADDLLIVAIDDTAEAAPTPGSTPRARYGALGYAGSTRAAATAATLAQALGLEEQHAWRIAPLQWRCMLYRLAPGANRANVLATLAADSRVQLVQPLNEFNTLALPAVPAAPMNLPPHYDDPYVGLQRGFIGIQAAAAQRWSQGDGVRVALIDSGVDAEHPDLVGRVSRQRDVVGADHAAAAGGERHGTEMAGVIAAVANNRQGIVGVAPLAQLWAYRACWPLTHGGSSCNSFTLAKALGAAIADGADVINLSLAGPADPLLQRLVAYAIAQGVIVVGAMANGGELGFPAVVPGVLSVTSSDDNSINTTSLRHALRAPGRDILTLAPGGGYGYATGASLAAAHVSGAVAVLRALQPRLDAQTAHLWLTGGKSSAPLTPINLCEAVRQLRPAADCTQNIAAAP